MNEDIQKKLQDWAKAIELRLAQSNHWLVDMEKQKAQVLLNQSKDRETLAELKRMLEK